MLASSSLAVEKHLAVKRVRNLVEQTVDTSSFESSNCFPHGWGVEDQISKKDLARSIYYLVRFGSWIWLGGVLPRVRGIASVTNAGTCAALHV